MTLRRFPAAALRSARSPWGIIGMVVALLAVGVLVRLSAEGTASSGDRERGTERPHPGSGSLGGSAESRGPTESSPARVSVNGRQPQQTIQGFGAYQKALTYGNDDFIPPDLRSKAIDALYREVRLSGGNLDGSELLESPGSFERRRNDNPDPRTINWQGFQTSGADALKGKLIDIARPLGFDDFYLGVRINTRYASPWLTSLRNQDYNAFLEEAAEQVAATKLYWQRTLGITTEYAMLFNEPLTGNRELDGGEVRDVVELVKRVGARLERDGLGKPKFVIGNEETEEASLRTASAVLGDPLARQYVGAIGYHTYPYGSAYSSIEEILKGPGSGRPNAGRIRIREQLRDLGRQHSVPVWMTEVSDPGWGDPRSFSALRARAVHIHDELTYADASVYQGMMSMWDTKSQTEHFRGDDEIYQGDGNVVLVDLKANAVTITGIGRAIGHYARWLTPGRSVRLPVSSNDPLVLVTAFRDDARGRASFVVVNNAESTRQVNFALDGIAVGDTLIGEESTASASWTPLVPVATAGKNFTLTLPPASVTSVAATLLS